jgi:hypothetical protein
MKMTALDRMMLLATCLLAAYQVAVGIDGFGALPITAYTIGFGGLLVAALLLIILDLEALDSAVVVVISTVIPLSISLGLIWQHLVAWRIPYLVFSVAGLLAIAVTRSLPLPLRLPTIVLTLVHGVAGMAIFLIPLVVTARGETRPGFALVGLGGAMIGLGGLALSFLKAGRPVVPRETILKVLPGLLLCMTIAFVLGFALS